MPTLLIESGFRFFFYSNEHEPMHVHVTKGDSFAKVELDTLNVPHDYMKPKELKKALEIIETHKYQFEKQWNEYFT